MNTATDAQFAGSQPSPFNVPNAWLWPLALFAAGLGLILILFFAPIQDAVYLWSNRSAYNHCYLIIPISLFLLWDNRRELAGSVPRPSQWGLVGILGFSAVWIFAAAAGIAEGEHIAIVGLIQALIIAIFGVRIYRQNLIAFLYLWLLVPTGTFLLPTLQQIALVQTEFLLNISSIPNFVEGFIVEVPTGRYHIAPGCAGLNFILSSIALTPLYAYLIYQSWIKRFAAMAIMLIVAMVANAIRIFAIIALAEWSNRKIDIVDDHLLYGWGFFAVVLFVMGWLGLKFEDPPKKHSASQKAERPSIQKSRVITLGLIAIALILPAPLYYQSTQRDLVVAPVSLEWPQKAGDWTLDATSQDWQADFPMAHDLLRTGYSNGVTNLDVNIAYYWQQIEGRELISGTNLPGGAEPWFVQTRSTRNINLNGKTLTILEYVSTQEPNARLVWHWYWIDNQFITSSALAKLRQAKVSLLGGEPRAASIMISTPIRSTVADTAEELTAFVEAGVPFNEILSTATAASN